MKIFALVILAISFPALAGEATNFSDRELPTWLWVPVVVGIFFYLVRVTKSKKDPNLPDITGYAVTLAVAIVVMVWISPFSPSEDLMSKQYAHLASPGCVLIGTLKNNNLEDGDTGENSNIVGNAGLCILIPTGFYQVMELNSGDPTKGLTLRYHRNTLAKNPAFFAREGVYQTISLYRRDNPNRFYFRIHTGDWFNAKVPFVEVIVGLKKYKEYDDSGRWQK